MVTLYLNPSGQTRIKCAKIHKVYAVNYGVEMNEFALTGGCKFPDREGFRCFSVERDGVSTEGKRYMGTVLLGHSARHVFEVHDFTATAGELKEHGI